jgi:hypothetical protein
MGAFIIGKVLSRALMTGKAGLFYIISKMKGKRFMRIGVAGKAVFQFKMGPPFVAHGAFRNDIFSPGRMLFMAIKTGNLCLMLSSVAGDRSRLILVAFYTVSHVQGNQFRSRNLLGKNKQ